MAITPNFSGLGAQAGGTTITVALGGSGVVGDTWVLKVVIQDTTKSVSSISDDTTGGPMTWTQRGAINAAGVRIECWSTAALGGKAGGSFVTVTLSGSATADATLNVLSGPVALGAFWTAIGSAADPLITLGTLDPNNYVVAGFGSVGATLATAKTGSMRRSQSSGGGSPVVSTVVDRTATGQEEVTCAVTLAATTWVATALELRSVISTVPAVYAPNALVDYYKKIYITLNGVTTDVSGDVLVEPHPTCEFGILSPGPGVYVADPGELHFSLNNGPTNSAGKAGYYSLLHANRRAGFDYHCIVELDISTDDLNYFKVFTGRITDISVDPGAHRRQATHVVATDPMGTLAETYVKNVSVQSNQRLDQLIVTILTNSGDTDYLVLYAKVFDQGLYVYPFACDSVEDEQTSIRAEIHRLCASEGAHFYFYNDLTGAYALLHNRLHDTQNVSVDQVSGSDHPYVFDSSMVELEVDSSRQSLLQRIQGTGYATSTDTGASTVIGSLQSSDILVQPGQSVTVVLPYRDPNNPGDRIGGINQVVQAATTDYTMNSAKDGSGTDLTANFTVTAASPASGNSTNDTVKNNGTTAGYITKLNQRGDGVYRRKFVVESVQAPTNYGVRNLSLEMPYAVSYADVADFIAAISDTFSDPNLPQVKSMSFWSNNAGPSQTSLSLASTIRILETQTGVGYNFIVRGQRWEFYPGKVLRTTYHLEPSAVATWTVVAFDSANFTASGGGTWTVESGDVSTYIFSISGKLMRVAWYIATTTVVRSGADPTALKIKIPLSRVAARSCRVPIYVMDNTVRGVGYAQIIAGSSTVDCLLVGDTQWAASTNNTGVWGEITFETP